MLQHHNHSARDVTGMKGVEESQQQQKPDESTGGVRGSECVEEGDGGAGEEPGQQQLAGQTGAPGDGGDGDDGDGADGDGDGGGDGDLYIIGAVCLSVCHVFAYFFFLKIFFF